MITKRKKFICIFLLFFSCNIISNNVVKIGEQKWMNKNLDVGKFQNGDVIAQATNPKEWNEFNKNKVPAWCYFDYNLEYSYKGKIYNWYSIIDNRKLSPLGWHIPSEIEWDMLAKTLGGKSIAGNKLKSKNGWGSNGNGIDEVGFNAKPGAGCPGYGDFKLNPYWGPNEMNNDDTHTYWWSSSWSQFWLDGSIVPVAFGIESGRDDMSKYAGGSINQGFYVRCIKDE